MTACLSPNGCNVYGSSEPVTRLLVATTQGVATLERSPGGPWQLARRALEAEHISSLLFERARGGIFAGIHGRGLYRSTDGGATWHQPGNRLTEEHVYSLASSGTNGDVVLYAGTEPARLFRSLDYGDTWEELESLLRVPDAHRWTFPAAPHQAHVKNITCDPSDPKVVFVSIEQGGLFKTVDGGQSWKELAGYYKQGEVPYKDVHRVALSPTDTSVLYLASGTGVYHSIDGGTMWKQLTSAYFRVGYPDALLVDPHDEDVLFVAGAAKSPFFWLQTPLAHATVLRSSDRGRTWDELEPGLPEDGRANIEAMALHSSPGHFSLFIGTTDGDVHMTEDNGASFSRIAAGLAPISKLTHNAILEGTFVRG